LKEEKTSIVTGSDPKNIFVTFTVANDATICRLRTLVTVNATLATLQAVSSPVIRVPYQVWIPLMVFGRKQADAPIIMVTNYTSISGDGTKF
jgi:hypothetical protein